MPGYLTYEGFDFTASPYSFLYGSNPFKPGATQHVVTPKGLRPGSFVMPVQPTGKVLSFIISIKQSMEGGLFETALATALRVLSKPKGRLLAGFTAGRHIIATPQITAVAQDGPGLGTINVDFVCEDAYQRADTPSADVRIPTLVLTGGSTTSYALSWSLTPAGSAPAPLSAVLTNQNAGVAPLAVRLTNESAPARPGLAVLDSVPALSGLVIDGERRRVRIANYSGAGLAGWWPLEDVSGDVRDFSGRGRDLSAQGSATFRELGIRNGFGMGFNGTTSKLASADGAFGFTGAFSVACWFKPDNLAGTGTLLSKANLNKGWGIFHIANQLAYQIGNAGGYGVYIGGALLVAGEWQFIAWTFTSGRSLVYRGSLTQSPWLAQSTTTIPFAIASTNEFRIGGGHGVFSDTDQYYFDGVIDEPAAWAAELTEAQVRAVWEYGPWAAVDRAASDRLGVIPDLMPAVANTITLRADHSSTAPTFRSLLTYSDRYA